LSATIGGAFRPADCFSGVFFLYQQPVRVALDAMGGDLGPSISVPGAALALSRRPDTTFLMFGDESVILPVLSAHPALGAVTRVIHTAVSVKMGDKPSQALRQGRRTSSMWMALEAVKKGEADVTVSAGNTGALMAMSKICLRTMAQIDRPALAAIWPTLRGQTIVLDVGATIGADAQHYVDLSIMGAAMAAIVFNLKEPTVGLLNVGVEEIKGIEEVKAAARILREAKIPNLKYHGFVEGDDIGQGTTDVVVTEGFTGNIALKTAEGTAKQISSVLRSALTATLMSKLGALLARKAFETVRQKLDPRNTAGGVFLGLDGIVIKSHGGADPVGYCGAIELGYEMVRHNLQARIRDSLAHAALAVAPLGAETSV
jgi:glycerol-3-phosphate acyltransferase PlsX